MASATAGCRRILPTCPEIGKQSSERIRIKRCRLTSSPQLPRSITFLFFLLLAKTPRKSSGPASLQTARGCLTSPRSSLCRGDLEKRFTVSGSLSRLFLLPSVSICVSQATTSPRYALFLRRRRRRAYYRFYGGMPAPWRVVRLRLRTTKKKDKTRTGARGLLNARTSSYALLPAARRFTPPSPSPAPNIAGCRDLRSVRKEAALVYTSG